MTLAIIGGVVTIVTAMFGGIMSYLMAKLTAQQAAAAVKVEAATVKVNDVKMTLEATTKATDGKLKEIAQVNHDIHTLVNRNMGVQLKLNAELSRWKANQTKDQSDIHAAEMAEAMYADHMHKQGIVDDMEKARQ